MALACMTDEFYDLVSHHLPPEQPVVPCGGPQGGGHGAMRVI